jgi:hypothetical protein
MYRPWTEQDEFQVPQRQHIYIYGLCDIGARTQPWGTSAIIFLGVENSPSNKKLNFLSVRKEAISLMSLVENYKSYNLYRRPECHVVSKAFSISKKTAAVEILGDMIRQPDALKYRTVICSKTKLTSYGRSHYYKQDPTTE